MSELAKPLEITVQKWIGPGTREDEFAIFDRVLSPEEVRRHYLAMVIPDENWHLVTISGGVLFIDGKKST